MFSTFENSEKVTPEQVNLETDQGILDSEGRKWGLPLKEVYKHALTFYKDKDGKAVHLTYGDRLKLVAFTQQTAHGPLESSGAAPVGVLDVIGRDRRAAWHALGNISQVQAMAGFVHTLDRLCPQFKPYITAIQKDLEDKKEQENKLADQEQAHQDLEVRISLESQRQQTDTPTEEQQVQRVKEALNAQTYRQFLEYAKVQFPENVEEQAVLIRQLQDRHYQQYLQQLAIDRRLAGLNISETPDAELTDQENNKAMQTSEKHEEEDENVEQDQEEDSDDEDGFPPLEEARMWTRTEVVAFKDSALGHGGRLTVSHGETITIRVPTHEQARSICWEFATDHYDIGFGVYFEWTKPTTTEMTIVISESDDDDDDDDDIDNESSDAEAGAGGEEAALTSTRPPVSVIVPIFRRECHSEVYAGTHTYPGEGIYLLKFDNTYSLWRSKTLYYKIYYTQ